MERSIILADDHEIIRRGLRELLEERLGTDHTIREASSCRQLRHLLDLGRPALLLLDLQMGDGNAMDELEAYKAKWPDLRILVFSMSPEHLFASRVSALGAMGFLNKASSMDEMVLAIRQVLAGRPYVSHAEAMRRMDGNDQDALSLLSDRELMVMRELLKGLGVVEIAERSGLKPNTITTYKARLLDKLGVSNLLELQRMVQAKGWS